MHLLKATGKLISNFKLKNTTSLPNLLNNLKDAGFIPTYFLPLFSVLCIFMVYVLKLKLSLKGSQYFCFTCKWVWQFYLIYGLVILHKQSWFLSLLFYLGLAIATAILIRIARKYILTLLINLKNKKKTKILKLQVMTLLLFLMGLELVLIF